MANGHGGYRRPANPAPASGPGRLSKRTDGGPAQKIQAMTDQPYGAREETLQQERSAPMSQQNNIAPMSLPNPAPGAAPVPFDAPTQRPNEPITHGVDIGPGAGPEVLGPQPSQGTGSMTALLQQLSTTSITGSLGQLLLAAQARNA